MNIDNIVTKFEIVGECDVNVAEVVKQWDEHWCISQWKDEYRLCHHNRNADNFTRTDLKITISKQQAKEIIVELDLVPEPSPVFVSGKTWRKSD